ncbi:MAG TPA: hemerythrin domain-containing protein [Gammaproteobacteria bacterium]|mgnify:CR=1 FL=1|nr:hemerythrin domain-containing protein [Gammaproteobacteria bacterium]
MDALIPESAPDFSDPLGLLLACHQRMREHCELLQRCAQHLSDKGLDEDAKKAAAQVHRYFSTAAMFHHRDEEEDLFPLLIRSSMKMADVINQLKQQHAEIQALWQELAPLLARPASIENPTAFTELSEQYASLYQKHLAYEEQEFLNIAVHMLSQKQLDQIGCSMKKRRQEG